VYQIGQAPQSNGVEMARTTAATRRAAHSDIVRLVWQNFVDLVRAQSAGHNAHELLTTGLRQPACQIGARHLLAQRASRFV
jgi:hypothetical protein